MTEIITTIEPYIREGSWYDSEAGFRITTSEQEILLTIDDSSSCCESWGYFLTEDNTDKFIGAELLDITITDTNLSTHIFTRGWDYGSGEQQKIKGPNSSEDEEIHLDDGQVMFVNLETSQGKLQFVAYNSHNGYYGHEATVISKQLNHSEVL